MALKDDEHVETRSVGETPSRKVVVWPVASQPKRGGRRRP